jgi:hypothetical protein
MSSSTVSKGQTLMLSINYTHTAESTIDHARAIVAALRHIWGDDILPAIEHPFGKPDQVEPAAPNAAAIFGLPVSRIPADTSEPDSEGVPYDSRIHSDTKAKTDKGAWRRRRNVPDEAYTAVLAELKAGTPASAPPPPVADTPAPTPDAAAVFAAQAPTQAPPPPVADTPAPQPDASASPTPPAPAGADFGSTMKRFTEMQKAGKVATTMLADIMVKLGQTGQTTIAPLAKNAALLGPFNQILDMLDAGLDLPTALSTLG